MIFASPQEWDLTVLDHGINLELLPALVLLLTNVSFKNLLLMSLGSCKNVRSCCSLDAPTKACHKQAQQAVLINQASLCPYSGFQSEDVKATCQVIAYYDGMVPTNDSLKKHFKTCSPVFNIPCHNKPTATST